VHEREVWEWEENVRPILPKDAEILGEIPHEQKVHLLQRAKAVLFPIEWPEPFGLVMIEAMACGTPVIATPCGSVPEVIADGTTGWIVSVDRYAEEAAERLGRIDEIDPDACRERVERLFSRRAMVEGYERVFETVTAMQEAS
jgi:glycosyltransferase involved in cell wall biosynthesis